MGEVNIYPLYEDSNLLIAVKEVIKISHLSPASERCPPLAVLHTITSSPVFIKVEFKEQPQFEQSPLKQLYNTCLKEAKVHFIFYYQLTYNLAFFATNISMLVIFRSGLHKYQSISIMEIENRNIAYFWSIASGHGAGISSLIVFS